MRVLLRALLLIVILAAVASCSRRTAPVADMSTIVAVNDGFTLSPDDLWDRFPVGPEWGGSAVASASTTRSLSPDAVQFPVCHETVSSPASISESISVNAVLPAGPAVSAQAVVFPDAATAVTFANALKDQAHACGRPETVPNWMAFDTIGDDGFPAGAVAQRGSIVVELSVEESAAIAESEREQRISDDMLMITGRLDGTAPAATPDRRQVSAPTVACLLLSPATIESLLGKTAAVRTFSYTGAEYRCDYGVSGEPATVSIRRELLSNDALDQLHGRQLTTYPLWVTVGSDKHTLAVRGDHLSVLLVLDDRADATTDARWLALANEIAG